MSETSDEAKEVKKENMGWGIFMKAVYWGLGLVSLVSIAVPFLSGASVKSPSFKTVSYSSEQKKHHGKGLVRTKEKLLKFKTATKYLSFTSASVVVPASIDISAMVSLPENQGQCGSCWAFSLTKALRSEFLIAGHSLDSLEFNYLLNNCGPGPRMMGCGGGDFPAAQSFLGGKGPGLNAQNPYTQRAGRCAGLPVAATAISYAMVGNQQTGPSFQDLAALVSGVADGKKHMLSIDVAAGRGQWENYSSGIYSGCSGSASSIDHMIDMVGYDCETSVSADKKSCAFDANGNPVNGDGFLIVENNWTESWGTQAANGHGGYMKTRYMVNGQRCNAIATDALVFTVDTPVPVPPAPPAPPVPPPAPGFDWGKVWTIVKEAGVVVSSLAGIVALIIVLLKK